MKIARTIAYHFLGKISLIYAYGFKTTRNPGFEKVQVAYNNLFRATGLRASTPQRALNICFGTSLENFARHSVINDGFKMMRHHDIVITEVLDRRTNSIRHNGIFAVDGTFMHFFARKFNEFDLENRKKLASFSELGQIKAHLKKLRSLDYDKKVYDDYYWISLAGDIQE